jgi:hypothetical protein
MKMNFQGGASVLASRGAACGVPKEHLKIARHFNAGSICKWHQVPKGRPTSGQWFSRPSGTCAKTNPFPALKRRAIFRKSLRDCALFAIASILLAAFGATAQTTNALSDAEIQGRQLAQKFLDERPTENFTNSGVLQIRDGKGKRSEIPVDCWVIIFKATNWFSFYSIYEAGATNQFVTLCHIHAVDKLNTYSYSTSYWTNSHKQVPVFSDGPFLGKLFSNPRLSGSELMTPFANSDFWLGDLGLEFFHWPEQKILKKEFSRGRGCMVLESTNPNPSTNGYSRVVSWIDEESYGIVHAEAYDAQNKLLKVFDPKSFKKVNGQWELKDMEIRNVQTGSRTRIEFDLKAK